MFDPDDLYRRYDHRGTPWLRLNFVASLDGAATVGGSSGALNDPWDLQVFETLRALADVVVVAAGTVREEGYDAVFLPKEHVARRRAQGLADHPRLAIVTRSGDLDPASEPFRTGGRKERPIVFAGQSADVERLAALRKVAEVVQTPGEWVDLERMIRELHEWGLGQILCEGGPHLFGSLLEAGLVDELCLTLSPFIVGGTGTRIAVSGEEHLQPMGLHGSVRGGVMTFLSYRRTLGPANEKPL